MRSRAAVVGAGILRGPLSMRLNLPNLLTLIRIFLVPILVAVLLTPPWATGWLAERLLGRSGSGFQAWFEVWRLVIATAVFLIAAVTDFLDGFLARSRGEVTDLGKLLDPIADKLLTVSAFISLVELGLVPAWMVVVITGREFAVTGMRSFAASRGVVIAATGLGKVKTVAQIVAIAALLLEQTPPGAGWMRDVGLGALWVSVIFALWSMTDYFARFISRVDLDGAP